MANHASYPAETAGRLMVETLATASQAATAADILDQLKRVAKQQESLNYVYIVDAKERLQGVITLTQLLGSDPSTPAQNLMQTDVVTVRATTDQERMARLALQHQLKAIPVMDSEQRLLGVVPPHVILQVLHDEHVEDMLKTAGLLHRQRHQRPHIGTQIKQRLPWLLLGLGGGLLAAAIVRQFEAALLTEVLLAAFIPTIVYLADALGTQVQTIYIRSTAYEQPRSLAGYLLDELAVNVLVAFGISVTLGLVVAVWFGSAALAWVVGLAAVLSMAAASVIAIIMPWLFQKSGFDPAVASGPLATIVRDITSLLVYFTVARYILLIL